MEVEARPFPTVNLRLGIRKTSVYLKKEKIQSGAWLAVLTKELGQESGVGWRSRVGRGKEAGRAAEGLLVQNGLSSLHTALHCPLTGMGVCVCVHTRARTSLYDVQGGRAGGETQMARSQLWKHNGGLAGQAHFLTHLETSPHYGLFEIRGQAPRVRQPVSSE